MNKPFVSVIVPNYNHSKYLDKRLSSIFNQTYGNFEVIFLDDKSTDDSLIVANKYKSDSRFSRIVINEVNSGSVFRQWKKGIDLATGDLIWIAESDDYCENTLLETLVDKFNKYPDLSFAFSSSIWVNQDGEPINYQNFNNDKLYSSHSFLKKFLLFENNICNASCALFDREKALKCSRYTDYLSSGDYMFWVEMAMQGNVYSVSDGLNYFRRHIGCLTGKKMLDGLTYYEDYEISSILKDKFSYSHLRIKLSKLFKLNILLGLNFKDDKTKDDLIKLWGGPLTKIDTLLLKFLQKIRVEYHIFF